jgi:SPP1 family predicted phage head-tail adaptor
MARTGKYRKRINIQSYTKTRGGEGGYIQSWATDASRWANINPISGQERVDADQVKALRTHTISMRFYSGTLSAKQRVLFGTRVFHIVSVVNVGERGYDTILDVMEVETA